LTATPGAGGSDAALARAADLVRALPIRWVEGDVGGTESEATARGCFDGASECARILAEITGLEPHRGSGFGGAWPILRGTTGAVSPALPVVVREGAVIGPDGEYGIDDGGVWREAVGVKEPYLATDVSMLVPGVPFDLLWFGEGERFLVRDGCLEIDDLFGSLRVPASAPLLDRLFLRRFRVDRGLLASLPCSVTQAPQVVEVRRPAALSAADRWRDATRFLARRADVEDVRRQRSSLEARLVGGFELTFDLEDGPAGWRLALRAGDYPLHEIRLEKTATLLRLSATLDPRVDALAPGMRGRLIFDLRSDLVALG